MMLNCIIAQQFYGFVMNSLHKYIAWFHFSHAIGRISDYNSTDIVI